MAARSPGETETSGFTEDQRAELTKMIAEAVGAAKPLPEDVQPKGRPAVTDDQWAQMSDRQRQNWVRETVESIFEEQARHDADADRDRKIAELEARKAPEPEKAPSVWTRLQEWAWGPQDPKG